MRGPFVSLAVRTPIAVLVVAATAPAFERHFERERRRTQMPQHVVCLLSPQSDKERLLLTAFQTQLDMHNRTHADDKIEFEVGVWRCVGLFAVDEAAAPRCSTCGRTARTSRSAS